MDIKLIKQILEELDGAGCDQAYFKPDGKNTIVSSSNKKGGIVAYHTVNEEMTPVTLGVQSIKGILSRIGLFDEDKVSVTYQEGVVSDVVKSKGFDSYAKELTFKQGRRKSNYFLSTPSNLFLPRKAPEKEDNETLIEFDKEYVNYLMKVIGSISYTGKKESCFVKFVLNPEGLSINISNGSTDAFNELLEINNVPEKELSGTWDLDSFQRALRESSRHGEEGTARMVVNKYGCCVFKLKFMEVIVTPMVT